MLYDIILFFFMYLFSFHLVIGGYDWFMVWLGLEVNMMMFIIVIYKQYNMINIESCFKYFFVQSLGSAVFIGFFYLNKLFMDYILCFIMSYKVGAGPFFFWFPSVCMGISWMSCFVLMTFQKIIPLLLMSMFISWVLFFMVIVSLMMGVFGSFNQKDLKRLVAYSSIYHLGWIMLCMMMDSSFWMNYLIMYMFMIFPMFLYMGSKNIMDLTQVVKVKSKLLLSIVMLSVAGMPPFLGFFLKWFAFTKIMNFSFFYLLVLVVSSVVMFYVYFRIIYDVLMGYYYYGSWSNWSEEKKSKVWLDVFVMVGIVFGFIFSFCFLF